MKMEENSSGDNEEWTTVFEELKALQDKINKAKKK